MPVPLETEVRGVEVDAQTRCVHYYSAADIVAIKMKCCGVYHACKDCHAALAGHAITVWPRSEWDELAVLCGACGTEMTIREYLESGSRCPACDAAFNPGCRKHHHFYFEGQEAKVGEKMDTKAIGKILGPRFDAISGDGARALKELGLPEDAAILDVGTGNGNFAIYLASQGYQVLTGEPSTDKSHYAGKDWAENAKKVGVLDNIRFEAFDARKLPFESEAFDAVFFFGVLHHIDENVRSEVFREALRVSKENGVVVFFEPRKQMLERIWVDDPGHPLAANPSDYLPDQRTREHRIEGSLMDIFIYKKAATCLLRAMNPCERDVH